MRRKKELQAWGRFYWKCPWGDYSTNSAPGAQWGEFAPNILGHLMTHLVAEAGRLMTPVVEIGSDGSHRESFPWGILET